MEVKKHLNMLGREAEDKITGFKGVITSVGFDLYGCVQVVIVPPMKDGDIINGSWLDVSRLTVSTEKPVMAVPNFEFGSVARGEKGPERKPLM